MRYFHLDLAAGRNGGAAHALYYVAGKPSSGGDGAVVLRVLHEQMEPGTRISRSLE